MLNIEAVVAAVKRLSPDGEAIHLNPNDLKFVAPVIGCEQDEVYLYLFIAGYRNTGTEHQTHTIEKTHEPMIVDRDTIVALVGKFQNSNMVYTIGRSVSLPTEPVLQQLVLRMAEERGCVFDSVPTLRMLLLIAGYRRTIADTQGETWSL